MDRAGILNFRQKEGKQYQTQLGGWSCSDAQSVTLLILLTLTKDESISKKNTTLNPGGRCCSDAQAVASRLSTWRTTLERPGYKLETGDVSILTILCLLLFKFITQKP